ncbi:MAG: class II aldolase/adducin family protein [Kiritimatiellae bacterium]|nr:class II aldolase/adducin family protein [Kiritimatiellia bacterium]
MPLEYADLREALFESLRSTLADGVAVAELSSLSCADRTLGVFVVRPAGVPLAQLRPADLPVLSLADGHLVAANTPPPADAAVHLILYRHIPEVLGIAGTRSPFVTAWAQAGREIPAFGTAHAEWFDGPIPLIRMPAENVHGTAEDTRIGAGIVRWFAEQGVDPLARPAALVESHGAYSWGRSLAEALRCAAALETIATIAAWTVLLQPKVAPMPRERLATYFLRARRKPSAPGADRLGA